MTISMKTIGMVAMKNILIVDDSVTNVFLIESVLTEYGYGVMTSLNALEAEQKMQTVKPDLILLDLLMPQVSGFDFIKKIKKDPAFAEIPVVVVSAVTDEDSVDEILSLGAIEYIKKPVVLTTLIEKIESVLTLHA